jgi:hypothetical protein
MLILQQAEVGVKLEALDERGSTLASTVETYHGEHLAFKSEVHDSLMNLKSQADAALNSLETVKTDAHAAIGKTQSALDEFKANATTTQARTEMRVENVEAKLDETQGVSGCYVLRVTCYMLPSACCCCLL